MRSPRWLVGGLIGAGALVVAGQALAAYVSGRLVVGVVAVLVLAAVLVVGLVSLARARRYIERELGALRADPPGGALYLERRRQTLELRRRNVAPDLDVLADATAAEEAERGYTGKYLVATTVLIGLVGTFGGLMETLARVAPALKGDLAGAGPAGALGLIAGPLAGLHVTFGTSVVAIMVTLALALVQGDVALHHERLLALLQERTRHVLLPELWPAEESVAERTVRAVNELRAVVAETLARSAEASGEKLAAVVRVEVQRLVEQVGGDLRAATLAASASMKAAVAASSAAIEAAGTASRQAVEAAGTASRETMATAAATIEATVRERDASAREDAARAAGAVEAAVLGAVSALGELRGSLGAELQGASAALSTSAADLHATARTLSPALAELAPQLGALTAEVALLAARADSPDPSNAVLDELVRLGEDVERLVTQGQPGAPAPEAALPQEPSA